MNFKGGIDLTKAAGNRCYLILAEFYRTEEGKDAQAGERTVPRRSG